LHIVNNCLRILVQAKAPGLGPLLNLRLASTLMVFQQIQRLARPMCSLWRRGGCMRRFVSWVCAVLSISLFFASLTGCSSGSPTTTAAIPTPTKITLAPGDSSIDLGATLQFTAAAQGPTGGALTTVPIVFSSSNPAVLSFVP